MDGTLFMDTIASVTNLPLRLGNFMRNYTPCIKTAPSRANIKLYVAGQIGTLERKNVENIALESACSSARYPSASAQIWRCSTINYRQCGECWKWVNAKQKEERILGGGNCPMAGIWKDQ